MTVYIKKCRKKGLNWILMWPLKRVNDLIGVSAVCAYVDDIYQVAELIKNQQDIRILKIKDYIQEPKESGYQSLHLILEIAIPFQKEIRVDKTRIAAPNCCHGLLGKSRSSAPL